MVTMIRSPDAIFQNGEYLEHYGVKGMKWGVRKVRRSLGRILRRSRRAKSPAIPKVRVPGLSAPSASSTRAKASDYWKHRSAYTTEELRQITARKALESQLRKYVQEEAGTPKYKQYAKIGKNILTSIDAVSKTTANVANAYYSVKGKKK